MDSLLSLFLRNFPPPLALVAMLGAAGCGGRHVQLLFTPQNEAGGIYACRSADPKARSEHRELRCEAKGSLPTHVGNTGRTAYVDIPDCESGAYKTITIMDADEDNPTVYITCGQAVFHRSLRDAEDEE